MLALGEGAGMVLDTLPPCISNRNWPAEEDQDNLEQLIRSMLAGPVEPLKHTLTPETAHRLVTAFTEQVNLPEPEPLKALLCALPEGVAETSLGPRFVGRADDLPRVHRVLYRHGTGGYGTALIAGGAGSGKTRLAIEYVHRFGPRYYRGGVFWIDGSAASLDSEFWRVLKEIDPQTPDLAAMRAQGRNLRRELRHALRAISEPALFVVDDIPEPAAGERPLSLSHFCPGLTAIAVLATSRQNTREPGVGTISVGPLESDSAVLLLTDSLAGISALTWPEWQIISDAVGELPIALDLVNRAVLLNSISPEELLKRLRVTRQTHGTTMEIDHLGSALRDQVPADVARGIGEAFAISLEKLDPYARALAVIIAQMATAPIPEEFVQALPEQFGNPAVRAALTSRHFVTAGGGMSFGVMHRLMADYLRSVTPNADVVLVTGVACIVLSEVLKTERPEDSKQWTHLSLCLPHAEVLFERGLQMPRTVSKAASLGVRAASLVFAQGEFRRARRLLVQALQVQMNLLGENHPDTLRTSIKLGIVLRELADHQGSLLLLQHVFAVRQRTCSRDNEATLAVQIEVARSLDAAGQHNHAQAMYQEVVDLLSQSLGADDARTLASQDALAESFMLSGDYSRAKAIQQRVLLARQRLYGEEHVETLGSLNNLARSLSEEHHYEEARGIQEKVLGILSRVSGDEHPRTLMAMANLASTLSSQGEQKRALSLQRKVLDGRTRVFGNHHPETLNAKLYLAIYLEQTRDTAGALQQLRELVAVKRLLLGEKHPETLGTVEALEALERRAPAEGQQ
jgi:tetratricopeptide (TPR) repeat protein